MKKATFSLAILFTAKAFTTKLNFVNKTAKQLNLKKSVAFEIADNIEASTDENIEPQAFKALFITAATKHVQDKMLNAIVPTQAKATVKAISAEVVENENDGRPAKRTKAGVKKVAAKAKRAANKTEAATPAVEVI